MAFLALSGNTVVDVLIVFSLQETFVGVLSGVDARLYVAWLTEAQPLLPMSSALSRILSHAGDDGSEYDGKELDSDEDDSVVSGFSDENAARRRRAMR